MEINKRKKNIINIFKKYFLNKIFELIYIIIILILFNFLDKYHTSKFIAVCIFRKILKGFFRVIQTYFLSISHTDFY